MEGNKLLTLLVTMTVGIIFIGALLAPVIEDTSTTEKTFTNEGMWRMAPNTNGDVYTYDNTTHEWSLNGTVVNNANNGNLSVILLDDLCIRSNGWIRGAQLTGNSVTTVVTNDNDQTVITGNGLSGVGTYDLQGYGVNPNGDHLLTAYDKAVYMNGDSAIYATGTTTINSIYNAIFHITGSIDDGVTIVTAPVRNTAYTISDEEITNVVIDYTPVSDHKDLYKLNGITFDYSCVATPTEEGDAVTITDFAVSYSSYVVPYEITAELSQHLDAGEIAILAAIPIMAIAALILLVVRYFVAGRD